MGKAECQCDKAAVMQRLSRPNNVIVSQPAERGSMQSADSSARLLKDTFCGTGLILDHVIMD